MPSPSPPEIKRRTRAAWVYSGLKQEELARESEISLATIRRILAPKDSRQADRDERERIADACGVPRWFIDHGFQLAGEDSADLADVVGRMSNRLEQVEAELRDLRPLTARLEATRAALAENVPGLAWDQTETADESQPPSDQVEHDPGSQAEGGQPPPR